MLGVEADQSEPKISSQGKGKTQTTKAAKLDKQLGQEGLRDCVALMVFILPCLPGSFVYPVWLLFSHAF